MIPFETETHTPKHAILQPGTPSIDVRGLFIRYETKVVLENVSFLVEVGQRVAVVGPNGAGKSTLFKVIAGVLAPTEGAVNVYGQGPGRHICISYLPQRSQVDWRFPVNVTDVVMMGRIGKLGLLRWPRRQDWQVVQRALEEVGLADLARRQINELSGGQQQRMFIARALAQEAEVMLMDEPLTGLDAVSGEAIYSLLELLQKRRITILISTHDLDDASNRFDRVMLLNRRLLGYGRPEGVFTPQNLMEAYGGHLHLIKSADNVIMVGDTCCDEGEGSHGA